MAGNDHHLTREDCFHRPRQLTFGIEHVQGKSWACPLQGDSVSTMQAASTSPAQLLPAAPGVSQRQRWLAASEHGTGQHIGVEDNAHVGYRGLMVTPLGNHLFMVTPPPSLA